MIDPQQATPRPQAPVPEDPATLPFPLISDISAARWLLVFIIAAAAYFFHGFLVPVLAATIITFASWSLSRSVQRGLGIDRTTTAALFVLVIVLFLVVPITMALLYAFRELQQWIYWVFEVNANGAPAPLWMVDLPRIGDWIDEQWSRHIGRPGAIAELVQLTSGETIASIYRSILAAGNVAFHLALNLLFMLIALFIFYRDGDKIAGQIDVIGARILPRRWERLSRVVPLTISATVTGMTLIAMGEGVVLGIAYWIAGVPSPVTLGVITGFMALIPGGAPLCFTLVSIYLVASGSALAGVLLFVWGSVELFIVDKTIRPVLVGGPVKMPFLPTFFGLVGGVKTMGIVGLFVGPVLMALLVAIWREWLREIRTHPQRS
ncbi:AI-2E family transporter [Paracoccus sp. WLY502]|uniref:AI-2E family transporter n=1 Tax=Paracoccus yibinensis TaxID=3068891 RepID=UPI002796794E|nr:AI-2E family transporter [Paracoccus sp. WLY502]MDQ1901344.1 AI-2E family transporter [Paracoccus sp. WLY502]